MTRADALDALRWWGVLQVLGLLAFPLAALALRSLPDRGWTASKLLGPLLTAWAVWFVGSIVGTDFTRVANGVAALALGAVSLALLARRGRAYGRELWAFVRSRRRELLVAEAIFALAFVAWTVVRAQDASLAEGEKFMDLAFFNSFLLNHELPPDDLSLRGETVNYYYFGYAIWAGVGQLSGVESSVGFNLTNVSLFAITVLAAFGLCRNLAALAGGRATWLAGAAGAFLVAVCGNLDTVRQVVVDGRGTGTFDWFGTSRLIVDRGGEIPIPMINEYPSFSFLLGEIHPHVMALPVTLLVLTFLLALVARPREGSGAVWRSGPDGPLLLGLVGLLLGTLVALNTWDIVAYGGLTVLALAAATAAGASAGGWLRRLGRLAGHLAAVGVVGVVAFLPFHLQFTPITGAPEAGYEGALADVPLAGTLAKFVIDNVSINDYERSAGGFMVMFGIVLVVLVAFVGARLLAAAGGRDRRLAGALAVAALCAIVAVAIDFPLLGFLPLLGLLALWLAVLPGRPVPERAALALIASGALLALGIEVFYLDDGFRSRKDTVFKVYLEVWIVWAVAGGYGVWSVAEAVRARGAGTGRRLAGVAATVTGVLVLACGSLYLLYATPAREGVDLAFWEPDEPRTRDPEVATDLRIVPYKGSLDGLEYLAADHPDDLAAIRWLRGQPPGAGVAEAPGFDYSLHGRVVTATGQPGISVWPTHQRFWHRRIPGAIADIKQREEDLQRIFQTLDPAEAERLLRRYDVQYVFLGDREKTELSIPQEAMVKFASFMDPVFRSSGSPELLDGTTIFRLR